MENNENLKNVEQKVEDKNLQNKVEQSTKNNEKFLEEVETDYEELQKELSGHRKSGRQRQTCLPERNSVRQEKTSDASVCDTRCHGCLAGDVDQCGWLDQRRTTGLGSPAPRLVTSLSARPRSAFPLGPDPGSTDGALVYDVRVAFGQGFRRTPL